MHYNGQVMLTLREHLLFFFVFFFVFFFFGGGGGSMPVSLHLFYT